MTANLMFPYGPYPVVVVSHGYPGSRMLMSYLGENLATKGYVVVSIAHTDATYSDFDANAWKSAFVYRSLDQRFIFDELERLNKEDGWLKGLMDTDKLGLIGYSMGGYGGLRTMGALMTDEIIASQGANSKLLQEKAGYQGDKRVKAAVLFAPAGWFTPESLENITAPTLWVVGTADKTVGYKNVVDLWNNSENSDRYLLSYDGCGHNVAPNPEPKEAFDSTWDIAKRWVDPVWDTWRLDSINCHFVTAFFGAKLKGDISKLSYLDVKVPKGSDAVYSVGSDGKFTDKNSYWPGFYDQTAVGLTLEHKGAK
ncbi:dienelactone hydrolase family protein [uncultured Sphaerochaeta sp.]|uniref:alpha/beta hydrolase family protein n=1 Tax=uncultured Sphaerochaeta sp. TaxID=886478 RepID=UPI002A0A5A05|nr:dienelactone hydrolase family protein [uncultured Sphaerochaeta sp.]